MATLVFRVIAPASMPDALMGIRPDTTPFYEGTLMPNDVVPPAFGAAIVVGGTKVGDKWYGCTYTRPPFVIPGLGEVHKM